MYPQDKVSNLIDQSEINPEQAHAIHSELAKREADRLEQEQAQQAIANEQALASVIAQAATLGIQEPIEPLLHSAGISVVVDKSSGTISVLKPLNTLDTAGAEFSDDGTSLTIGGTSISLVKDSSDNDHALLTAVEYDPTSESALDLAKIDSLIQQARKAGPLGQELAQRLEVMAASQMSQAVL